MLLTVFLWDCERLLLLGGELEVDFGDKLSSHINILKMNSDVLLAGIKGYYFRDFCISREMLILV